MSVDAICTAIDTQLETIAGFPGDVVLMNVTYAPIAGKPYLMATMAAYVRRALTLGRDKTFAPGGYLAEHRGTYRVDCVVPQDAGRTIATRLQGQVLSLFRRGTTLTSSDGDLVVFDAGTPMPLVGEEGWYRAPVDCPWYVFEAS